MISRVDVPPLKLLAIGLVAGLVVGLLGVGASTIVVPALTFWIGRPEHKAHGTTCMVVLPTALVGAWLYSRQGNVNWALALNLGMGGAVGALIGTRLMKHLSPIWLRRVFATTALLAGWQMLR
ncbi:MAG TPA: sulfite exporter TauE/SafE family protein [Symbiobacteriaceae bacterium]|nr:sulfite exporter TauE/SafE family protein [Symbiobacteriaceae bacterium]